MKRYMTPSVSAILVLAIVCAGWAQAKQASSEHGRNRLETEVRHELVMLPFYGVFDNLAFRVDGNKVTLLGQVTRPSTKTAAERVVKRIEGVESVDNRSRRCQFHPTMTVYGWRCTGQFMGTPVLTDTNSGPYRTSTLSSRTGT